VTQIIPAILAKNKQEFDNKINAIKGLVDWVQIDVCNNTFTKTKTYWNLDIPFKTEVHLMIENPKIEDWQKADRIIVHREAMPPGAIHELPDNIGLAFNPQTPVDIIKPFMLLLGVNPGRSGQKFDPAILPKIQKIRSENSDINIEIDGGINLENGKACVRAGANILAVGNFLFKNNNIKEALERLQNL